MKTNFIVLSEHYKNELLNNIIPFWLKYSLDKEYGGYFTCLDKEGKVFDTDKFVWLQARQVWMLAFLYNNVIPDKIWLDTSLSGAGFLEKYGRDKYGNWYFSLTKDGKPLVKPYNIFSDCFSAMAFAELSKATNNDRFAKIATDTFENILKRKDNPKGLYNKSVIESRNLRNFALPMILSNLILVMEEFLGKEYVYDFVKLCIKDIFENFYDPDSGFIRENINADGTFSDTFEGRLINPGHGIEAMWFAMDIAEKYNDSQLAEKAAEITIEILEKAWDKEFGGIFYFMDIKGKPLQQLEWDQKLWWVHIETLISLIKGYYHTQNPKFLKWFIRVNDYTWAHFPDKEYGEWWGYLNRRGEVLIPLKGGKWKGCYHIPRGLYQVWKTIEKILEEKGNKSVNENV